MCRHQAIIQSAGVLAALILFCGVVKPRAQTPGDRQGDENMGVNAKPVIQWLKPDPRGGQAFRVTYLVKVPIDILWRFKTDFTNNIFTDNKYIVSHRYLGRRGNTVNTEIVYAQDPDVTFRWQTTVHSEIKRIDFILIEPKKSRQRFNYGHIQLDPVGGHTKVIHEDYFDFFGAFIWAKFPWKGGMADFLKYMAAWEQEAIHRVKDQYR